MTIHIRIWRVSLAFKLKLLTHRKPEPDPPAIVPAVGFMMPGPDYLPDDI